jgi:branched-chain amino acid transport system ATP-binding protein
MTGPVLETRGLCKRFGSLTVARDITLTLPRGARHALIGPNGAGKTTLINLITGVLPPDDGRILLNGEDVTVIAPNLRVKRGLARTFQINTLFPALTPLEAVALAVCEQRGDAAVWWRGLSSFREEIKEAYAILEALGLATASMRATSELAYGQQRLLEIALALATRPKVLMLDEPTAGVPRQEAGGLLDAIAGLSSDISVLLIEHDMDIVFRFASRIVVMVGGGVLVEGTPAEITADARVREVYLGAERRTGVS